MKIDADKVSISFHQTFKKEKETYPLLKHHWEKDLANIPPNSSSSSWFEIQIEMNGLWTRTQFGQIFCLLYDPRVYTSIRIWIDIYPTDGHGPRWRCLKENRAAGSRRWPPYPLDWSILVEVLHKIRSTVSLRFRLIFKKSTGNTFGQFLAAEQNGFLGATGAVESSFLVALVIRIAYLNRIVHQKEAEDVRFEPFIRSDPALSPSIPDASESEDLSVVLQKLFERMVPLLLLLLRWSGTGSRHQQVVSTCRIRFRHLFRRIDLDPSAG